MSIATAIMEAEEDATAQSPDQRNHTDPAIRLTPASRQIYGAATPNIVGVYEA